ncbi:LexA family transcriptional repressor [Lysinibacillus sp. KCTC 33748]|uniref:LexA family protein n=1 Tax=unclassified Lysinibacillus TaxID=2636778 RepID=UPI0009A7C708|nr:MULTISPECIES: XRE family transcriptional regulator [unclassified Lysinibacillus]OXS75565.1 LexA family transcriptional repressor [Lysinibacillus sp. KCTC 33748]SKB55312.1 repressor LexA [Lysinibacillus sp. AC-3]
MTVGEKIKTLRKEFKLTQDDLAKKLGVAPTAVSAWERNANKPLMDKIMVMAELFNVPFTHFFEVDEYDDTCEVRLPLYGNVSCGEGLLVFETPTEYRTTPEDWIKSGDYFYVRASGDSMMGARIYDGDILFMRKQEEVENGEIAAVCVDDEIVLKRVFRTNGSFILQSENSNYPPRIFNPMTDKNVRIIGKLEKLIVEF